MTVVESYLELLAQCFTPDVARRVVEFRPDACTENRPSYLRERANEGTLNDAEREEYAGFVDTLDFVGVLKAKARTVLSRGTA